MEARNLLMEAHRGLAVRVAVRTGASGADLADLVQIASLAILEAAETFDPDQGHRFSSYAWRAAVHAVARASFAMASPVAISDAGRKEITRSGSSAPFRRVPVGAADEAATAVPPGHGDARAAQTDLLRLIDTAGLSSRQLEAVRLRYGLDGQHAHSLGEAAARLGVSRAAVAQRVKSALVRLRAAARTGAGPLQEGDAKRKRAMVGEGEAVDEKIAALAARVDRVEETQAEQFAALQNAAAEAGAEVQERLNSFGARLGTVTKLGNEVVRLRRDLEKLDKETEECVLHEAFRELCYVVRNCHDISPEAIDGLLPKDTD